MNIIYGDLIEINEVDGKPVHMKACPYYTKYDKYSGVITNDPLTIRFLKAYKKTNLKLCRLMVSGVELNMEIGVDTYKGNTTLIWAMVIGEDWREDHCPDSITESIVRLSEYIDAWALHEKVILLPYYSGMLTTTVRDILKELPFVYIVKENRDGD